MIINQLMALLLPSVVTIKVYENLEGEENRVQKIIKKYLKSLLIVNILEYAIIIYIVRTKSIYFYQSIYTKIYITRISNCYNISNNRKKCEKRYKGQGGNRR